jgi:TatA/E family protein of Tat protein translocase
VNLGPAELMVILILALLVFGPNRLPEVGRQIGSALRELRRMQTRVRSEINSALAEPANQPPPAPSTAEEATAVHREPDVDHPGPPPEPPPSPGASGPPEPDGRSFL